MKRLVYASYQFDYEIEVISECDDEDGNPTCWALKFQDENGEKDHFVWITKYDDKEYVVEDSEGRNLSKGKISKTLWGAKKQAAEVARRQVMKDLFTD